MPLTEGSTERHRVPEAPSRETQFCKSTQPQWLGPGILERGTSVPRRPLQCPEWGWPSSRVYGRGSWISQKCRRCGRFPSRSPVPRSERRAPSPANNPSPALSDPTTDHILQSLQRLPPLLPSPNSCKSMQDLAPGTSLPVGHPLTLAHCPPPQWLRAPQTDNASGLSQILPTSFRTLPSLPSGHHSSPRPPALGPAVFPCNTCTHLWSESSGRFSPAHSCTPVATLGFWIL